MSRQEIADQLEFYRSLGVKSLDVPVIRPLESRATPPARPASTGSDDAAEVLKAALAGTPAGKPARSVQRTEASETMTLESIREELGDCQRCQLSGGRTHIVFGTGSPNADLVFVGEAPGADEDRQGEPFVGRAGQLLTKIIEAIDLKREDVYICNVLKCRPPGNRNPEPVEVEACSPFLRKQIAAIRPKVVCCLGTFAAQTVMGMQVPISRLRGEFHEIEGVRYMATFHPAYLLRNASKKREVWDDMKKIRAALIDV